jgi:hypothetical protein
VPLDLIAAGDVMLDGALPAPVAGGRVHGRIELRAGGPEPISHTVGQELPQLVGEK